VFLLYLDSFVVCDRLLKSVPRTGTAVFNECLSSIIRNSYDKIKKVLYDFSHFWCQKSGTNMVLFRLLPQNYGRSWIKKRFLFPSAAILFYQIIRNFLSAKFNFTHFKI